MQARCAIVWCEGGAGWKARRSEMLKCIVAKKDDIREGRSDGNGNGKPDLTIAVSVGRKELQAVGGAVYGV